MDAMPDPSAQTLSLTARLKSYVLPGGEAAARGIRGIEATQAGDIRSGPNAKWIPLTAKESVDARTTSFRWEARMGTGLFTSVSVVDAYEDGHGRLVVKKGPVQLQRMTGADLDIGELQRYLGYIGYCPPMIVNNPSLHLTAVGPHTLQIRDRDNPEVSVETEIDEDGRPQITRAMRPMLVGKKAILTPWSASGSDPDERDGVRVWRRMEASWHLPEGVFPYVRIELTSFTVVR
jgi:hypothetical protein